jgi:hypothetical protein
MGRTPVPEPRPDQPPAPAIDHLFDGAADPAAENTEAPADPADIDLTAEQHRGVCDLPETTDHRRSN